MAAKFTRSEKTEEVINVDTEQKRRTYSTLSYTIANWKTIRLEIVPLYNTGLINLDIEKSSKEYWRHFSNIKHLEQFKPFHHIKGFTEIHCTSIYYSTPSVVLVNHC